MRGYDGTNELRWLTRKKDGQRLGNGMAPEAWVVVVSEAIAGSPRVDATIASNMVDEGAVAQRTGNVMELVLDRKNAEGIGGCNCGGQLRRIEVIERVHHEKDARREPVRGGGYVVAVL